MRVPIVLNRFTVIEPDWARHRDCRYRVDRPRLRRFGTLRAWKARKMYENQ
jgi:hypothetical protein